MTARSTRVKKHYVPRKYERDLIDAVLLYKRTNPAVWEDFASLRLMNAVSMYENARKEVARKNRREGSQ